MPRCFISGSGQFLSTLSLRRATHYDNYNLHQDVENFYPRSPCGERRNESCLIVSRLYIFLSTLSLRRATMHDRAPACRRYRDFYPRSPCGERPQQAYEHHTCSIPISIHALLAESDHQRSCTESYCIQRFLSTLSLRRATTGLISARSLQIEISIHALLAESDDMSDYRQNAKSAISIHALLAESDDISECTSLAPKPFLSTLSLRRATAIYPSSTPR